MSGQSFTINADMITSLTLGDMEDVEELSGIPFMAIQEGAALPMRAVRALAFVVRRKGQPELTYEECRDMTLNDLRETLSPKERPSLGKLEQPAKRKKAA